MAYTFPQQRISKKQKTKNDYAWAKSVIDEIERQSSDNRLDAGITTSTVDRKKVNYDLFNGKLDREDFEYVCKPYGMDVGEMPAELRHYDIMSPKLRVLFGEEIKRPFNYKVVSTNPEAITDKEREKADLLRQYITEQIQQKVQQTLAMQAEGGMMEAQDPEAQQQQMQQVQQAMTPPEIEEYMKRTYQDGREIQAQQILNYLEKKERLRDKFNKGWKHALISGEEIYWSGIVNGEPTLRTVNPLFFDYDKDPDLDYIQDGQWAKYTMRMTPSSVVDNFGEYMSDQEIKDLYADNYSSETGGHALGSKTFSYDDGTLFDPYISLEDTDDAKRSSYIKVIHTEWKSLRKIGFLTYMNESGVPQEIVVDEKYKLNKDAGDLELKWEWIPEVWEGTKIGKDLYINMRPKPNQHKDLDNLYSCKLGYVGTAYNNLNAASVSLIDRMKPYQYLYNIIMYRLELDLASDKGKKFLADINQIPSSMGMDMDKWLYYFDALGIAWVNPQEEGKRNQQSNFNQWNAIDLTMSQTINQKVQLLEYLEAQIGEVAGVSKQREGQIGPNELVGNTQQAVVQSSHITEEWFSTHSSVKKEVMSALIDTAKVAWGDGEKEKLQYVGDDMTVAMFKIDPEQFSNTSYGIFVSDSARDQELFMILRQLTQAALQNQMTELSDVIKMFSTNSTAELRTMLETSEDKRRAREQQMQQAQAQSQEKIAQAQLETEQKKLQLEKYKTDANNETKIEVAEINSFRNQMDQDSNDNGIPDQLEIEKLKAQVHNNEKKITLENRKLDLKEREMEKSSEEKDKDRKSNEKEKAKDRKANKAKAKSKK